MVVNRTAITSVVPFLFSGPYNASKAAISVLSDMVCLEFGPLDVQAVDLETGTFRPKLIGKLAAWKLPKGSLYEPARLEVETMAAVETGKSSIDASRWAEKVERYLLMEKPLFGFWSGRWAIVVRQAMDRISRKELGMIVVERKIR
jgi:1-acylglycerone phosphate reductase